MRLLGRCPVPRLQPPAPTVDFRFLDSSSLGEGAGGMHVEIDFSSLLQAFELPDEDNPPALDSRALADTIGAKAARSLATNSVTTNLSSLSRPS